ncbi:hypothetical protein EGW08_021683 [Elysia chlorotica]|uniref:Uncharacterized protein n=1 Tax=Elysia chlorotica TaxID=188477 RepID=A0A433SN49_ELYCH|nr:hypothetical protein EGW08_021683 [Elysia chlorotica]
MSDIQCPAPNCTTTWPSTTVPEVLLKLIDLHERTAHPTSLLTTAEKVKRSTISASETPVSSETMKRVLLAMTEEQHDKRSWRANALIGTFLLLSLSLSFSVRQQSILARDAILTYNNNAKAVDAAGAGVGEERQLDPEKVLLLFTAAVAVLQVVVAAVGITAEAPSLKGDDYPDKEALAIVALAHSGSVFLRDFLSEVGVASESPVTVQDIAFFSPVIALAALWLVTSVPARPVVWLSLCLAGLGCSMVSSRGGTGADSPDSMAASNRATLVCSLVFFTAAMRNIVLRQIVHEGVEIKSRPLPVPYSRVDTWLALAGLGAFAVLSAFLMAPTGWGLVTLNALVTCCLSSALLLVSTQVLKVYDVVCTAVFGVWALLLEALLTTPIQLRPSLPSILLALLLLAAGHWLFLRNMSEPDIIGTTAATDRKSAGIQEQYTRLEFLLFASAVVGIIFYVFQPRVSERDLNTLSYVGLDTVIRRLLSVASPGEQVVIEAEDNSHAAHAVSMN